MRDTHTGDDCRIPEDGRRVREVVEQPHSCAEQHGSQIDVELVEQPRVHALLDRFGAVQRSGMTPEEIYAQGKRARFGGRSRRNCSTVAYACRQSEVSSVTLAP
jgi:hypothetical protein